MKLRNKKILVTGSSGFLGINLTERLKKENYNFFSPSSKKFDLRFRETCKKLVKRFDIVLHLAAQVGGIGFLKANPGEVFYNNVVMGVELMEAARVAGVEKFVTMSSVCEYPDVLPLPFKEDNIWNGYPATDTAAYAFAKKTLLAQGKMYRRQYGFNVIHIIPVNLYGPHDHFGQEKAHVIPALISKIVEAREHKEKTVEVWGSGKATREFLYVEDAVDGILTFTKKYDGESPINMGTGEETTIRNLVDMIVGISGFKGKIFWNKAKPEGTMRRQLDVSLAKSVGFKAKTSLFEGLKKTITWYEENRQEILKDNRKKR